MVSLFFCASVVSAQPAGGGAESRLREQRAELERIKRERQSLETRMYQLRGSVHDLSEEVSNLDRQADVTARLVKSLDVQLLSITAEVGKTTGDMVRAEDELTVKRAILQRRLVDIYKRGPLYSVEALLSAETFGALVSRYKYLHMLALRDRILVERVTDLRNQIGRQRGNLVRFQSDIEENRAEKAAEERRLLLLAQQREHNLVSAKRRARETEARLRLIARDEKRLGDVLASLEVARRRESAIRPNSAGAASTLRTSDLGRLDWPVEGTILYNFGRVVNPNNTTTRWNGIGIGAAEGTAVRAVTSGRVVVNEAFGTYGLTVIVQHGGGDYSVYGSLSRTAVQKGAAVAKGQVIGYVGGADPDLPSHLHFEIRPQGRAVDPLAWLRGTR
ncbi:MAG: peptidoglycan DD-metalloendopeptidase family protein [Gemmatimonadota bacterium]|nr:peptidoglycan DD-metalloendopeptidase family protein [Gemmatimonadota bacterium]